MEIDPQGYWNVSWQYLKLVELVADKIVKNGNANIITIDGEDEGDIWEQYDEFTKWSDHSLVIPLLFSFYHGVELLLKGFIEINGTAKNIHSISGLLQEFDLNFRDNPISHLLAPYISEIKKDSMIGQFLSLNQITIDYYYQSLKYPKSTKQKRFSHMGLQCHGADGVPFFMGIRDCSKSLRQKMLIYGESCLDLSKCNS